MERRACLWGECNIRYHEQALIRQIVSKDMSTLGQINGCKLLLKVDVPQSEAQTHRVVEIRAFPGDLWRSLWSLLPQTHSLSLTLTLDLDSSTTSRTSSGGPGFLSRTHSHCSILEWSGATAVEPLFHSNNPGWLLPDHSHACCAASCFPISSRGSGIPIWTKLWALSFPGQHNTSPGPLWCFHLCVRPLQVHESYRWLLQGNVWQCSRPGEPPATAVPPAPGRDAGHWPRSGRVDCRVPAPVPPAPLELQHAGPGSQSLWQGPAPK